MYWSQACNVSGLSVTAPAVCEIAAASAVVNAIGTARAHLTATIFPMWAPGPVRYFIRPSEINPPHPGARPPMLALNHAKTCSVCSSEPVRRSNSPRSNEGDLGGRHHRVPPQQRLDDPFVPRQLQAHRHGERNVPRGLAA